MAFGRQLGVSKEIKIWDIWKRMDLPQRKKSQETKFRTARKEIKVELCVQENTHEWEGEEQNKFNMRAPIIPVWITEVFFVEINRLLVVGAFLCSTPDFHLLLFFIIKKNDKKEKEKINQESQGICYFLSLD